MIRLYTAAIALINDVRNRLPGEDLPTPYMRELDAALDELGDTPRWLEQASAAPDMLEALKGILSNPGGRCSADQWQAGLRAVAKAEGRS